MTPKKERIIRKRRLFPRSVEEVVKEATKPLMHKQGKLYSVLLRDWKKIVGERRAALTRPDRLQFPRDDTSGATLHLLARPAAAPELAYEVEQMIEQCARYFGYRAIVRIIIHAHHDLATEASVAQKISPVQQENITLPTPKNGEIPQEMRHVLARIAQHVSASDKKK